MATLTVAEQGGRLLCDFDKKLFKKLHDYDLLEEDDRLEELKRTMKIWWKNTEPGYLGHVA